MHLLRIETGNILVSLHRSVRENDGILINAQSSTDVTCELYLKDPGNVVCDGHGE